MKNQILITFIVCLLISITGCDSNNDKEVKNRSQLLRQIEIGILHEEVGPILGEPESYFGFFGVEIGDDLPESFFMDYNGFQIVIVDYMVNEIRILSDEYSYDDRFYIGQKKKDALRLLSPSLEVVSGENIFASKFILLNDMPIATEDDTPSEKNRSYFNDPINDIRIFFKKDKVSAIYYYRYDNRHEDGDGFDMKYGLGNRASNSGVFKPQTKNEIYFEFEKDKRIIGTWKYTNILIREEDFPAESNMERVDFDEVTFLEDGEVENSIYTWTNGYLLNSYYDTTFRYEIDEVKNKTYLFVTPFNNEDIYLYVLEKVK